MPEKKISHCHKHIRKVAREIAAASYEELMSQDFLYTAWKKQHPGFSGRQLQLVYVNKKWGLYIEAARTTLALLLRSPIDEKLKDEIVEILALDSTLIRGRKNPATIAGALQQKN